MSSEQEYLSRVPKQYTRKEKFANWFYYYKWWLLIVLALLYVAGSILWNKLGVGKTRPDYRLAYVGSAFLPDQCREALETELARLAEDTNGDGRVVVEIRQYITADLTDPENFAYNYATEMKLAADISGEESYFFLMEDAEAFQKDYQVLAYLDGAIPEDGDFSAEGKALRWQECPVLAGLELGDFEENYADQTITVSCQEWLADLYFGRRFFYGGSVNKGTKARENFWLVLTAGAFEETR